jgi:hypothetical protein
MFAADRRASSGFLFGEYGSPLNCRLIVNTKPLAEPVRFCAKTTKRSANTAPAIIPASLKEIVKVRTVEPSSIGTLRRKEMPIPESLTQTGDYTYYRSDPLALLLDPN